MNFMARFFLLCLIPVGFFGSCTPTPTLDWEPKDLTSGFWVCPFGRNAIFLQFQRHVDGLGGYSRVTAEISSVLSGRPAYSGLHAGKVLFYPNQNRIDMLTKSADGFENQAYEVQVMGKT